MCLLRRQRNRSGSVIVVDYEADHRALLENHDAVSWLLALDREWPYGMFFLHPFARWLFRVGSLCSRKALDFAVSAAPNDGKTRSMEH
jgi:hypothetical protein